MFTLDLVQVDVPSIYPKPAGGPLPYRLAWAHPSLAEAIKTALAAGIPLVLSDCYRSLAASLARRKQFAAAGGKQLAKRPAESPHNFGLAIDIDVNAALIRGGFKNKADLDGALAACGLWCHRRDGLRGANPRHYNALETDKRAARWLSFASPRSTSRAVEARVLALYGAGFGVSETEAADFFRRATPGRKAPIAPGSPDYIKGLRALKLSWGLEGGDSLDTKTQRLIACLQAELARGV